MTKSLRLLSIAALLAALGGCASTGAPGASGGAARLDGTDKPATASLEEGLRLARMLRDNGRMEGAVGIYERLDQRGELRGGLLLEYATVAATIRPPLEALTLFGRVRQDLGGDPLALEPGAGAVVCNGLGRARLALGQNDAALKDFECALTLQPDNTVALNGKAVLLDARGAHDEAQALWLRAQDINPADFGVLNNLALSYLAQGKAEETIRLLGQLDAPKSVPALTLNLALAYLLSGEPAQADGALRRLVSERQAAQLSRQLAVYGERIRGGAPVAQELLAASRRMLALQDNDE